MADVIDKENLVVRCVDYLGLVTLPVFNSIVFMYPSMMHLHVYYLLDAYLGHRVSCILLWVQSLAEPSFPNPNFLVLSFIPPLLIKYRILVSPVSSTPYAFLSGGLVSAKVSSDKFYLLIGNETHLNKTS